MVAKNQEAVGKGLRVNMKRGMGVTRQEDLIASSDSLRAAWKRIPDAMKGAEYLIVKTLMCDHFSTAQSIL